MRPKSHSLALVDVEGELSGHKARESGGGAWLGPDGSHVVEVMPLGSRRLAGQWGHPAGHHWCPYRFMLLGPYDWNPS
jgi:hypothetical protein